MPAVVRGGRRQSTPKGEAVSKSPPKSSGGKRGAGKGGQTGMMRAVGGVPMPSELTAWLGLGGLALLLTVVLMTGNRAQMLTQGTVDFVDRRIASVGVNLQNIHLKGVSDYSRNDIKAALDFDRGQPLALMSLTKVRDAVEKVGWVQSATIRRQFPNVLIVDVVERPRLAVWQYNNKSTVIDDKGNIIPEAKAYNFVDLPLVVGEGANENATDILELVRSRPELLQKLEVLVRVDTRRWDLRLKNGTLIKLPALNQEDAMARLDTLIATRRVLDQGLAEIDLRDPNALIVAPFSGITPSASAHNATTSHPTAQ